MAAPESRIKIEHIEPARLEDLVDAQNKIFVDYLVPIRSNRSFFIDFLKSVGGNLSDVFVAFDGDDIVGYATPVHDGKEGWVGGIGVLPKYRGLGIGTNLMAKTEEFLRERGVTELFLEVIEENHRAHRLYERLGYQATRKLLCAEGKPARFEGPGDPPPRATLAEILPIHGAAYADGCWQRRKHASLAQSARDAEIYLTDGGFVMVRAVGSNGFVPFIGVVPEQRRKGIGTYLATFALTRLCELGAFKASVFNVEENETSLRMIDKFDFKITTKQIEMCKTL